MTTHRASVASTIVAKARPGVAPPARFGATGAVRDILIIGVVAAMAGSGALTLLFILGGPVAASPLGDPPVVAAAIPTMERDDRPVTQLQRDYDQTVPSLVASYERLERKLDRAEERLEEIRMAQRDLEALKTYTMGIATALGALILGVVAQITQSWANGRMLRERPRAE